MADKKQTGILNRTIFSMDNLPVLRGMETGSVDLIYLDPPFNSNRNYSAPIGSEAAGAEFKDMWTFKDTDDAWWGDLAAEQPDLYHVIGAASAAGGDNDKAYCIYMAIRLLELKRLLKPTGTLYLHCDQSMSHILKLILDAIFGADNFVDEVIWNYGTPSGGRAGQKVKKPVKAHETLLIYASNYGEHTFNREYTPYSESYLKWFRHTDEDGRKFQTRKRKGEIVRQYLDESPGVPLSNVWSDIKQLYSQAGWFPNTKGNKEQTKYPTQKPLDLLRRIVKLSSNEGDMVLDPFCGCATTCLAAEDLKREWIGIDISPRAYELITMRFKKELEIFNVKIIHRTDVPTRSDQQKRSKDIRRILFGKQKGICNGCEYAFPYRNFHLDHITPRAAGGQDTDDNLQLLCGACNSVKGVRSMEHLRAQLRKDGIIK
ncbi:MAG: HNH endonuclease [Alphaproteobacteria bacterium]|nr:HNH endonuclease [Alphaproteobacteria bacterium]MDA8005462.1 HNH endonuclease [Alphaproteobacteria bacterium]